MVVGADTASIGSRPATRAIVGSLRPFARRPLIPVILAGMLAGLCIVLITTPIIGRGDYGQWLMTSRYYSAETVPEYRTISALPPVVPAAIAAVRALTADPVLALEVTNALLLIGLGVGFYVIATVLLGSRLAGLISVALGLLFTDRFMELFAFGGILQIAASTFMMLAVAAFARASQGRVVRGRWWWLGSTFMTLAALTHVGTAAIAVPTSLAVAGISSFRLRHHGWHEVKRLNAPVLAGLSVVAIYWLLILLPSSREYVTNPASMAYRGPERLFSSMNGYLPTLIVLVGGAMSVAFGAARELVAGRVGGWVVLLACTLVPWGALLYSALSGAATDYPRFATPLLLPLVVALAGGLVRLLANVRLPVPKPWRVRVLLVAAVLLMAVSAPLAVGRYARQAAVYQPHDAAALNEAVQWIDGMLGDGESVLTTVRDGKWLEGMTGREALFSQPVRYAFRRAEWQRSVDADTLLRSRAALSNGYFRVGYTDAARSGDREIPSGLLLGMNHGGEYVDLLRTLPGDGVIHGAFGEVQVNDLPAIRSVPLAGAQSARMTTVRATSTDPVVSFTRQVTIWRDGTTLEIRDASPGNTLETVFKPPQGMAVLSVEGDTRQATACFTKIGDRSPCVGIAVAQEDATIELVDGALRFQTVSSDQLQILVTVLTAGPPAVDLRILDPAKIIEEHNVGAALLHADEPAFASRLRRLQALGFHQAFTAGPYRVLVHQRPFEDARKIQ